ncbi:hypothetical protein U1737_08330 [Sphingomonas sp. LB3N6]|uniref:hypothetical protein n=1 Tax=Sphingomonas fucosidasi TaxID=3096164 RepID=UPI002FCA6632
MSENALSHVSRGSVEATHDLDKERCRGNADHGREGLSNIHMILPASVRKPMGLQGDAEDILTVEDDQVHLALIGIGYRARKRSTGNILGRSARLMTFRLIERQKLPRRQARLHPQTGGRIRHDISCAGASAVLARVRDERGADKETPDAGRTALARDNFQERRQVAASQRFEYIDYPRVAR